MAIKRKLATPTLRRLLGRPDCTVAREEFAAIYLRGNGVEVGACNSPLRLPSETSVVYADCIPLETLRERHLCSSIREPDVISDLESMNGFADESLDFVIANHVLEHVENPLRALNSVSRVLKDGGIGFITVPDKRATFDRYRAVTPLTHIQRDFVEGPEWSRRSHLFDWAKHVERAKDIDARITEMERVGQNIHFHVWDYPAMEEMFTFAGHFGLSIAKARENRGEGIWILRKA